MSYFEAEWVNGGGHDCHAPHSYDYQDHDQQCQNCEKHKFARDFPWLDETRVCDECWWDAIKKNPEQTQELENYKNSTNAEEKRAYQKYKKLKDKMSEGKNPNDNDNDRERERERESRIANLKVEIQQLEQIANRTAEQEQELKDKKAELARLEQEKQEKVNPKKPNNYWPWIIGGGIVLVLVIGIIAYFWGKNKEK